MFALLPSSVAIAPPSPRAPQPIDPASWMSAADYPAGARRQGMEGAVAYRVDVDARGNPVGCQITLSAGPLLDQPTCDLLMRRSHFTPAMDGTGKTVAGAYVGRIRWQMPPRPVAPPILTVGKGAAVTFNKPFGFKPVLPAQQVFEATMAALGTRGTVVTSGAFLGEKPRLDLMRLYSRCQRIIGVRTGNVTSAAALWREVDRGFRPVVDRTFPVCRAADAHRYLEQDNNMGRVVLTTGSAEDWTGPR